MSRTFGSASQVAVTVEGLPDGVSASSASITDNTGTLNLSASATAGLAHNAAVGVTATTTNSGASGTLTLSVTAPTFSLAVTPASISIGKGSSAKVTVTLTRDNFPDPIAVTVVGLPDGVTADSLSISGNRGTLVIRVGPAAELGTYSLTASGSSGPTQSNAPITLSVLAAGSLDMKFGAAGAVPGLVTTNFDSSNGATNSTLRALALQPDGSILVAGFRTRASNPRCGSQPCQGIVVARYNSDGALDATFGASQVPDPPPAGSTVLLEDTPINSATVNAIAFSDAGILVAVSGGSDTLLRLTMNGALDPTFNANAAKPGRAAKTIDAKALAVVDGGKILVAGQTVATVSGTVAFAIARYLPDGTVDSAFGNGGILWKSFAGATGSPSANAAIFAADNAKVVGSATVAGKSAVAIMSFSLADPGSIDESFNGNGQALNQLGPTSPPGTSVANGIIDLGGSFLLAAITRDSANHADIALVSYQPDGSINSAFGANGVARIHFDPTSIGNALANALATSADKVVAAGTLSGGPSTNNRFLLVRYNSDGSADTAFGNSGILINVPTIASSNSFNAVTFQPDGKMVAVGAVSQSGKTQPAIVRYVP